MTGSVRLAGVDHDLVGADERRMSRVRGRDVAMVFQEPMTALNPTMRVGDQVAEAMLIHGTRAGPPQRPRRAPSSCSTRSACPTPATRPAPTPTSSPAASASGSSLAIALANDPALLVCDEPTTALDVTVQALVLDLIVRGVAARDAALLFITHDLAVVATVCERVLVMYGGRVVEAGPVAEVFTRPRHRYTQGLLGASDLDVGRRARPAGHHRAAPCPAPAGSRPAACSATAARTPPTACEQAPPWTGPDPATGFACHHPRPARPADRQEVGSRDADQPLALQRPRRHPRLHPPADLAAAPGPVVHALRGRELRRRAGRAVRHRRGVRLRQVDAAADPRRAGPPTSGSVAGRRHRHRRAARAHGCGSCASGCSWSSRTR